MKLSKGLWKRRDVPLQVFKRWLITNQTSFCENGIPSWCERAFLPQQTPSITSEILQKQWGINPVCLSIMILKQITNIKITQCSNVLLIFLLTFTNYLLNSKSIESIIQVSIHGVQRSVVCGTNQISTLISSPEIYLNIYLNKLHENQVISFNFSKIIHH